MSHFKEIDDGIWKAVLEGMVRRQYHLLVGAGINSDAVGGDGKPIPAAKTLTEQLITDFKLETDGEPIDLLRAYENVELLQDSTGRSREWYFKARFANCTPSWQDSIFKLGWRRIWTLNIDDVLEKAFKKYAEKVTPKPQCNPFIWSDPFVELGIEKNSVQIVHLHGDSQANGSLVFSILEYLKATSTRKSWHPVFGDEYLQEPFIIIGAKIRDEYDLAEFIRRGNKSMDLAGRPSLIVLKEISALQRKECIKWGLIPVQCDAKTFIEKLIPDVLHLEKQMAETLVPSTGATTLSSQARVFLQQFRNLKVNKEELIVPFGHDFYGGDEPIWADILNDYDVRFEVIDSIYKDIVSVMHNTEQAVYFINGAPGSGKSALLFRIARELIALGKEVFLFRGEERLSIESALWWVKHSPNSILLFDNIADFLGEIAQLCELSRENKVKLLVVSTERTSRAAIIVDELEYNFLHKYKKTSLGYLSDHDIEELIHKLERAGRLGKLTQKFIGEKRDYFRKTSKGQLFPAMADLEGALGYVHRIKKEYNEIKSEGPKNIYALTCIAHALGYSLPISIVSSATGIPVNNIVREVKDSKGQLFQIVVFDSKGLKARHRVIASKIIENVFSQKDRYGLVKNLAIHLSPHISISAIEEKSLYYRIIRELMDEKIIGGWLGESLTQQFYSDLLPYYDWDARYWEQRALAEASMNHLPMARSFAETAVSKNRDPFTLNTLGTILLKMATSTDFTTSSDTQNLYWESIKNLRASLVSGKGRFPHPYNTFFTHTIKYAVTRFKGQPISREIINEWDWWYKEAKESSLFASPDSYEKLAAYNTNWLKIATQNGG